MNHSLRTGLILLLAALAWGPDARAEDEDLWGIQVATYQGDNRVKLADNCAGHLRAVKGLDKKLVRVFHERDVSLVYYGRYKRQYNDGNNQTQYKPDPNPPLNLIRSLSMEDQRRQVVWPFRLASLQPYPVPLSIPAAWQLERNPGHYALQVAVFYNTEEMRQRRSAAEQYCKLLRDERQEAYVHHGPVHSSVCIGAFPRQALRTFRETDPMTGRIQVVQRIVDPQMLALQKKYPHHLQNGARTYQVGRDRRTNQKLKDVHLSFPVEVPKPDPFRGIND